MPNEQPPPDSLPELVCVKSIGALPVVRAFCRRLQLASIIDEVLEPPAQSFYSSGQVIEALVMNKLTSPTPLYGIEEWAEQDGVEPLIGLPPSALTDDRLAHVLDGVADAVEDIKTRVCLSAIERFGLDVGRCHWDLTSVHFEGSYDAQSPLFPLITYGYSSLNQGKRKQVRVANLVMGDGAVGGLLHKTYSGRQSDLNTVCDYIDLFSQIRDTFGKIPRLIGDSKLLSYDKMMALDDAGLHFIFPERHNEDLDQQYLDLQEEDWKGLDYVSRRERHKKPDKRTVYRAQERVSVFERPLLAKETMEAPTGTKSRKNERKRYEFRRIFIFSSEEQQAARKNRAFQISKTNEELKEQARKFQGIYWSKKSIADAQRAVHKIQDHRPVGRLYKCTVAPTPDNRWSLTYEIDADLLGNAEKIDGHYSLLTNVPLKQAPAREVFCDWKEQCASERRFADWKGPLKVRPLFLKHNKRIVGLVTVLSIALLIFCLIEREVRNSLPDTNGKMSGLLPINRPTRATGRNILQTLANVSVALLRWRGASHWQLAPLNPAQEKLLGFLGVDTQLLLQQLNAIESSCG